MGKRRRLVSDSEDEDQPGKSKPKRAVLSDDEEAGPSTAENVEEPAEGQQQPEEVVPDVSDDSDEGIDPSHRE